MTFWPAWDGRPDWGDAKPGTFEAYRGLTRWLKEDFGIESYLFAWYEVHQGSKLPILGWPIYPFDDEVIRHWRGRLERLAAEVPDLKGIVMAGAGGPSGDGHPGGPGRSCRRPSCRHWSGARW